MITDRNEAFMHNSCKKIAQLGKVIFTMSNQIREREEEALNVQSECENIIQKIVDDHQEKAEFIAKSLVHFRKKCVDESCKEFGSMYKQLKIDLANQRSDYVKNLERLTSDAYALIQQIKDFQNNSLMAAVSVNKTAESCVNDLKDLSSKPNASKREVKSNIQPILDQMIQAKKDAEDKLVKMKSEYTNKFSAKKKEYRQSIQNEFINRKDSFSNMKNQIESIKKDIDSIKYDFASVIRKEKDFYKQKHQNRDELMKETCEACNDIAKSIKDTTMASQKENKQHQTNLNSLKNQSQRKKKEYQMQLDSINRSIKEQKRQRHQFTANTDYELQKRKDALDNATQDKLSSQSNKMKKKKSSHKLVVKAINECQADTKKLVEFMKQLIDGSIEKVDSRRQGFFDKLQQSQQDEEKKLSKEYDDYVQRSNERMIIFESALQAQQEISGEIAQQQIDKNLKLKENIENNNRIFNETFLFKSGQFTEEFDKACEYNRNRLCQKSNEKNDSINRRSADKEKRRNNVKEGHQKSINIMKNEIQEKNDKILADLKIEETKKLNFKEELKNQEIEHSKLDAKNNFLTKKLAELKEEVVKLEEIYQNDVSNHQKMKRQFERKTKTEEQKLDEEFEMKIQIAQVNLHTSIENISKLYEADENQRGCEIIEAIRKVRDARNRVNEAKIKAQRELLRFEKVHGREKVKLQTAIKNFTNSEEEERLRQKVKNMENQLHKTIEDTKQRNLNQINGIQEKIDKERQATNQTLNEIENNKIQENNDFSSKSSELENEKDKIEMDQEMQINDIDDKYNNQIEDINNEHSSSVEKMKKRIEAAKRTRQEVIDSQSQEIAALHDKNFAELKRKDKENDQSLENIFRDDRRQIDNLTSQIETLSIRQSDLEFDMINPIIRESETKRIEMEKRKCEYEDNQLRTTFEDFYKTIQEAPNHISDEEVFTGISETASQSSLSVYSNRPQTAHVPKSSSRQKNINYAAHNHITNNNNNTIALKSARKETTKTPRVLTPTMALDPIKTKKRHTVVSPQLM